MNPTPGFKTSEFWITCLAILVGMLASAGIFDAGSHWAEALGFVQSALVSFGYVIARGITKSATATAAATVKAATLMSANARPVQPLTAPWPAPTRAP